MVVCRAVLVTDVLLLLVAMLIGVEAVRHGKNLIWTQTPSTKMGVSRIVGIEGDPEDWVPNGNVQVRHISAPNVGWQFKGLAYNYATQTLYWSEASNKKIQGLILNGTTETQTVFMGTSSLVEGIAVDWLSNNLYWTDALYNWVMMAPLGIKKSVYKIVARTNLSNPHSIAIYPQKGYVFWTDWGVNAKIEVSDLLGGNRRTVIGDDLGHPRGLTIDFNSSALYWVDSLKDTIESAEFNGNNRRVVAHQPSTIFYGVALYQNYIFVTEQLHGHLRIYDKLSGNNEINYQLGYVPDGIIMYDDSLQMGNSSECDATECEQLCIRDPLTGPVCACGDGYKLQPDGKSCIMGKTFIQPSHIYAISDSICQYPVNMPDMSLYNVTLDSQCFMEYANGYQALTFDARSHVLYYTENVTKSIASFNLEFGRTPQYVVKGVGEIQGIALDWVTGNLFWTDLTYRHIAMATKDGLHRTVIVEGLDKPIGIAVHPGLGSMFWTDRGEKPSLNVAAMDGSMHRELVNSSFLGLPNHVFIDFQKDILYWADSGLSMIRSYNLNTGEIAITYEDAAQGTSFFGVSLYQDYILWTDGDDMNGIHAARLDKMEKVRGILHPQKGLAHDVITFDVLNQPDIKSACGEDNGRCEQLCVPTSNVTYLCACGVGYELDENLRTCSSRVSSDNFILATDSYQKGIYQIEAESGAVHAIPLDSNYGGVALDFDPMSRTVYWTDNREGVIMHAGLGGLSAAVFRKPPPGSIVDGLAVDYANRLLFYTNTKFNTIVVTSLLDSRIFKTIVNESLDEPRDIIAHAEQGLIYWTDWGKEPKIEMACMDGSNRLTLLRLANGSWPNGLALETEAMDLFWVDAKQNMIGALNLITGLKRVVVQENIAHYFGVTVMGGYLYVSDWMRNHVSRIPTTGGAMEQFGPSRFSRMNGIYGLNRTELRPVLGRCRNSLCSHLCLPISEFDFVCACPDTNSTMELGRKCAAQPNIKQFSMQKNKKGDGTAITIGMVILGIVAACLIAFGILYAYRRCRVIDIPHGRLEEEPRVDTFYRITFPDTSKDETNFDSGIENPAFDYSTEDLHAHGSSSRHGMNPPL